MKTKTRNLERSYLLSFIVRFGRMISWLTSGMDARTRLNCLLDLDFYLNRKIHDLSFSFYAHEQHPFRKHSLRFIGRHMPAHAKILDLGSARGEMSMLLSKMAERVVGVEYVPELVEIARRRNKDEKITYHCLDFRDFASSCDESFDVCILSHVIEHLEDPGEILLAAARVSRFMYVEVPDFDYNFFNTYRSDLENPRFFADGDHKWEFDRDELARLISGNRLHILDADHRYGVLRYWCSTGP